MKVPPRGYKNIEVLHIPWWEMVYAAFSFSGNFMTNLIIQNAIYKKQYTKCNKQNATNRDVFD
jgi:hypothetical protein